jgi:uncharacterized FAD-dependent dehydrogenase
MKKESTIFELKSYVMYSYKLDLTEIKDFRINKKSIDTRAGKGSYVYSVIFESLRELSESKNLKLYQEEGIDIKELKNKEFVVIGAGPAGLFFSLFALYRKSSVVIIERGKQVSEREIDVSKLENESILNTESNNLFGEGGAGTFSDGKLGSNIKSKYTKFVFDELVKFGAPKSIKESNAPHIGTDILRKVIVNIREFLIKNGVKIYFSHKFIGFTKFDNYVEVKTINEDKNVSFNCSDLILAFGSADINNYQILKDSNVILEPKDYSIGVRIEHLRHDVDKILNQNENLFVSSKSYKYFAHLEGGRICYTFCMCPGGYVIPTPNEVNTMVVNGMSYSKRDNINSNSALLINVRTTDYYNNSVLDGITYRKAIEKKAYNEKYPYSAPIQKLSDFYNNKITTNLGKIKPSIKNYYFSDLNDILPKYICENLKIGIKEISKRFPLFNDLDAILTGVETRSSSPVFIKRIDNHELNIKSVYAIGDGSGYSGGITSAIIDGIKLISSF